MTEKQFPAAKAGGAVRVLNARKDPPDIRDRYYEPALIQLKPEMDNREGAVVLDQGQEGACTGFGLAAVINRLHAAGSEKSFIASPRMLYEMAKKHDEWPGEDYAGSSCRGAIRGWKNMGVCEEEDWPYRTDDPGELTVERARAARSTTLGAYYRLRPEINDYHAALNETGALYVSAMVHPGWFHPKTETGSLVAVIKPGGEIQGGHAFAIVGYNADGFLVQNSWGPTWGTGGFALWLYEDWLENISDGWAFRLAIPTPRIFGLAARSTTQSGDAQFKMPAPRRLEIAGHFVHFDDGRFAPRDTYWSTAADLRNTAERLRNLAGSNKYEHLLVYVHGGLNSPKDSARRVAALKEGFKRNGIYPYHIMYDTGLAEELKDTILRAAAGKRMRGWKRELADEIDDAGDNLIEDLVRKPVTPIWEEMKRDASAPFSVPAGSPSGDGLFMIDTFAKALEGTGIKIHLLGHSTGAVLIGHLLDALDALDKPDLIETCSLMAPACTVDFYQKHYAPRLAGDKQKMAGLPVLDIYALTDKLELKDNVALVYRKSLLFLVSRALERQREKPILGMARYLDKVSSASNLNRIYSDGENGISRSVSHGGFDNDSFTLNAIMKRILGKEPPEPFLKKEVERY